MKGEVIAVLLALQYLMSLPLALKRTVPAVLAVMVMVLVIPKVKVVEEKEIVAVALPVSMETVVTDDVSARYVASVDLVAVMAQLPVAVGVRVSPVIEQLPETTVAESDPLPDPPLVVIESVSP